MVEKRFSGGIFIRQAILDIPFTLSFFFFSHFIGTFFLSDLTVSGLGMVHVTIPNAIQSGRNVIMTCDYDLEDEMLYSVKWYKGRREFFRYTPKEIPSIKIFNIPGIRVDVSWCHCWFCYCSLSTLISYSDHMPFIFRQYFYWAMRAGRGQNNFSLLWSAKILIWFNLIFMFTLNPFTNPQTTNIS